MGWRGRLLNEALGMRGERTVEGRRGSKVERHLNHKEHT